MTRAGACLRATISGGEVTVGRRALSIDKPIIPRGLPSTAGRNTAILRGTFYLAMPAAVRKSE